jgi:NADP-dependent 3-hydroxy acid dehydrogenase YdfG
MTDREQQRPSALIFGARNLGKAVIELLVDRGWSVAGVARSQETLQGVSAAGALALTADVTEQASVREDRSDRQRRIGLRRQAQRAVRRGADG